MMFRTFAKRILPASATDAIRAALNPKARAAHRVFKQLQRLGELKVASGPFAGMKYVQHAVGSTICPKLLGTYELELTERFIALDNQFDLFIDIGAAEGYYAVGYLTRSLTHCAFAFEGSQEGRHLISDMAALNGVSDRLRLGEWCTHETLTAVLDECRSPIILCDCEGAELELMDLKSVPGLAKAAILMEVHGRIEVPPEMGFDHPTAMARLMTDRFSQTHTIDVIPIQPRSLHDWPEIGLGAISDSDKQAAMEECRSKGPGWLWMIPRRDLTNRIAV